MKYIITESQYKQILREGLYDKVKLNLGKLKDKLIKGEIDKKKYKLKKKQYEIQDILIKKQEYFNNKINSYSDGYLNRINLLKVNYKNRESISQYIDKYILYDENLFIKPKQNVKFYVTDLIDFEDKHLLFTINKNEENEVKGGQYVSNYFYKIDNLINLNKSNVTPNLLKNIAETLKNQFESSDTYEMLNKINKVTEVYFTNLNDLINVMLHIYFDPSNFSTTFRYITNYRTKYDELNKLINEYIKEYDNLIVETINNELSDYPEIKNLFKTQLGEGNTTIKKQFTILKQEFNQNIEIKRKEIDKIFNLYFKKNKL